MRIRCLLIALALFMVAPAYAAPPSTATSAPAGKQSADARFDKTGDGLVNVEDWKQMSTREKRAYATDSLRELGLDPEAGVGEGKTRADRYLEGLQSVYGP